MRKILFAAVSSTLLFWSAVPFQSISSQTENKSQDINTEESSGLHSADMLRSDLRVADFVAYVDVKERKLVDSIGSGDCENDKGNGYCLYLLKAELKEIFKGKTSEKTIEFYESPDMAYPKKYLMGEQIIFLVWSEKEGDKTRSLGTIENSTRRLGALEKLRKIIDPQSPIDENDESEPYSFISIKKEFKEADAIIYANVTNFQKLSEGFTSMKCLLKAKSIEVFKGDIKNGQEFEFTEDLLYRPIRNEDLGKQIIFLQKQEDEGKIFYERTSYPITDVEYNMLEKLRKIKSKK